MVAAARDVAEESGIAVLNTGFALDKNARDVKRSQHIMPNNRYINAHSALRGVSGDKRVARNSQYPGGNDLEHHRRNRYRLPRVSIGVIVVLIGVLIVTIVVGVITPCVHSV